VTALGGLVGYFLVGQLHDWLPYFLAVASSSFVYVALADLIPATAKAPLGARDHGPDRLAAGAAWAL
jgi:zinc and cadmium transporter